MGEASGDDTREAPGDQAWESLGEGAGKERNMAGKRDAGRPAGSGSMGPPVVGKRMVRSGAAWARCAKWIIRVDGTHA